MQEDEVTRLLILLTTQSLLLTPHCLLLTTHCLLMTTHCLLLTTPLTVYCSRPYSLGGARCLRDYSPLTACSLTACSLTACSLNTWPGSLTYFLPTLHTR